MKKTLLTSAVLMAMAASTSAFAGADTLDISLAADAAATIGSATASGDGSSAHAVMDNAANVDVSNSFSPILNDSVNDVNSDNVVTIGEDGNVLYANNADQAIAQADLDATVSGNEVALASGLLDASPLSPVTNTQTGNTYTSDNMIAGSYSGASGIAVLSQNTGHASSIQQSVVVQSNFSLK